MANRVQEDHKLIVGIEGSRSGDVPNHSPKDSIPGKRGIVYFNADGSSESTSGNTPSVDEDGNKEEGTTQPDAGGAGAGTSGGGYNSGNNTSDAGLSDPYPVDDPAQPGSGIFSVDSMTLGDVVKGVTGLKDCATNHPVDVRFDGQFSAPDGWAATSGALVSTTTLSVPSSTHLGPTVSHSPTETCIVSGVSGQWKKSPEHSYETSFNRDLISSTLTRFYVYDKCTNEPFPSCYGDNSGSLTLTVKVIDESQPGESYLTNEYGDSRWPETQPMQLSYNSGTGQYETHPMDGNVTPDYSQPVSSFQLCNEAGDPIKSYAQADGGQAIYNATTGIATFIDSTGKVTGFGDAQAITNGLPR